MKLTLSEDDGVKVAEIEISRADWDDTGFDPPCTSADLMDRLRATSVVETRAYQRCAASGCGEPIVGGSRVGWVHARTGNSQCDIVVSRRVPTAAHPSEEER